MVMSKNKLIIIGGPSGSGKTSACNLIANRFSDVIYYKNQWTTRKPRQGEEGKGAYQSVGLEKFKEMEENKMILIETKFAGNYYWYTREFINEIRDHFDKNLSLVIDSIQPIKNWKMFKEKFPEIPLVTIFLFSKDMNLLRERIMKRTSSTPEDITLRLEHAKEVLAQANEYDFKINTTIFRGLRRRFFRLLRIHAVF